MKVLSAVEMRQVLLDLGAKFETVAKEAEAAKALINFVRTPEATAAITAKGMDPATP